MLVQFGNNWIEKIPRTAKLDSAYGIVQFWLSSEFFSSNYFQIGQRVVLLHILILRSGHSVQNLESPGLSGRVDSPTCGRKYSFDTRRVSSKILPPFVKE